MESDWSLKMNKKCNVCGESLYKIYNIMGQDRLVRRNCICEIKATKEKTRIAEAKEKQQRMDKLVRNSLMDEKFIDSTFENWDCSKGTKKMYDLGIMYLEKFKLCRDEGLGLLIYGQQGNGKTYLSSAIANQLLKNFAPVICVSINGLLARIRETYNKGVKEAESDILKGLCNAELLIIDDLGSEVRSDWSKSMIYNIIDKIGRAHV